MHVNLADARWRTSSFSGQDESASCVEVAFLPSGEVAVRDTKDRSLLPHRYTAAAWTEFLAAIRTGEFDRA